MRAKVSDPTPPPAPFPAPPTFRQHRAIRSPSFSPHTLFVYWEGATVFNHIRRGHNHIRKHEKRTLGRLLGIQPRVG